MIQKRSFCHSMYKVFLQSNICRWVFCQDLELQLALKDRKKAVNNLWHARVLLAELVGRCCVSVWNSSTKLLINTLLDLVPIHTCGSWTNNKPATKMWFFPARFYKKKITVTK